MADTRRLFAILQKYDFSSKSQQDRNDLPSELCCLRYCKSTIFQANHNRPSSGHGRTNVVCDTAKVRFFKQITTGLTLTIEDLKLFAILQKYDFSSKSQHIFVSEFISASCLRYCKSTIFQANHNSRRALVAELLVVCDTAKVRFFKQITTSGSGRITFDALFAILQKYDFSSKSQLQTKELAEETSCLRYCKSTIFQANHNPWRRAAPSPSVVCDTAKVRFFKQITTTRRAFTCSLKLFAILQKYDFSSKSQPWTTSRWSPKSCLRYCKSTIFQANHNSTMNSDKSHDVVCDTAKVRFFKQITTPYMMYHIAKSCLRYCKSTIFQANHNRTALSSAQARVVCDTAKVRFFKQITTSAIYAGWTARCLRYCKSTIFQANHNLACCWYLLKLSWLLMVLWIGWSLFSLCGKTKINILLMHKVLDEDTIKTWNIAPSCLWQNVVMFQKATWRKLFHVFSTSWKPGCQ